VAAASSKASNESIVPRVVRHRAGADARQREEMAVVIVAGSWKNLIQRSEKVFCHTGMKKGRAQPLIDCVRGPPGP
jgi:1,4-dihydroxy-2-naphthoyl-CoA synthase